MKKSEKEFFPISSSDGGKTKGITRREFLKGTAGFVLLCGSGFALKGLAEIAEPERIPVGPEIREELEIIGTSDGASVNVGDELCFTVNEPGLKLLKMADGTRTLNEIIEESGMAENAEPVADFFIALGEAGFLTARLEVKKIAVIL